MTQILFKTCLRCEENKNASCFGWSGYIKKNGLKSLCSYCKTCQNELRVKRKYGVDYEEYKRMLTKQNNCCANPGCLANKPGAPGRTRFYIDHCHKTNKIRGLLCHQCNLALGHVSDDIKKLEGLIVYLKKLDPNPDLI
jgi:hypothetical protein